MNQEIKHKIINGLQHTVVGLGIQIVTILLSGNLLAGFLANVMFWMGRERRDHEIEGRIPVREWWRGWNLLNWSREDIFPPIIAGAALYAILAHL